MKEIGGPNGPSECQACKLYQWTESGYACVNEVIVERFYSHWKLSCVGSVEQNYYNPSVGKKYGIIVTKTVCYVCYLEENIVDKVELLTSPDIVGKNTLPLCRNFDVNIKFPATRWRDNP